jgi:hypothetical protein
MDKTIAFRAFIIMVAAIALFALIALYRNQTCAKDNTADKNKVRDRERDWQEEETFSETFRNNNITSRKNLLAKALPKKKGEHFTHETYSPYKEGEGEGEVDGDPDEALMDMQDFPPMAPQMYDGDGEGFFAGQAATTTSSTPQQGIGAVRAMEPVSNEQYRPVDFGNPGGNLTPFSGRRLSTEDLLPKDAANSKWAQVTPSGQGELRDQNFMNAGWHIGVNTQGQSLRNPNLQLRSDPLNPQYKVSPWMQTTIEPDVSRRPLEIGS